MFENLKIFSMASALAQHGAARQSIVAENIANADTPGYRARDVAPFDPDQIGTTGLRATRAGHLADPGGGFAPRIIDAGGEAAPNGNTVSIEDEMVRQAATRRSHDTALAVYQSGLRLLSTAAGRRR